MSQGKSFSPNDLRNQTTSLTKGFFFGTTLEQRIILKKEKKKKKKTATSASNYALPSTYADLSQEYSPI